MKSTARPLLLAAAGPLLVAADDTAMPTIERFEAGGWTPPDEASARAAATFLGEVEDHHGCRIFTRFVEAHDLRVISDGFATGSLRPPPCACCWKNRNGRRRGRRGVFNH